MSLTGGGDEGKKRKKLVVFYPDSLITQLSVFRSCLFKLLSEMENSIVWYFLNLICSMYC